MRDSVLSVVLVLSLLAATVVLVLLAATMGVGATAAGECSNSVHVDAFRADNATIRELQDSGSASTTEKNVGITVSETDAFLRVDARNPNGYCVAVTVEISSDVAPPAELGKISATNSSNTATWEAMQDLEDGETYTRVRFEVPAGSSVQFAPSKLRVQSLSWTGSAESKATGVTDKVKGVFGFRPELEQNTYEFSPDGADTVTVDLTGPEGERVEEWQAVYQNEHGDWVPVSKTSDESVYYEQETDSVKFKFNTKTTVKFTANPGVMDKARHDYQSYTSSWKEILNVKLPWSAAVPIGGVGA